VSIAGLRISMDAERTEAVGTDPMVTIEQARQLASMLPRTEEALVRDRVKFRVGEIVYLAFSGGSWMACDPGTILG
jgi:hypothetical protein